MIPRDLTTTIQISFAAASGSVLDEFRRIHGRSAINCWYSGPDESVAMWRSYTNFEYGVAISTTVGRLKAALEACALDVYLGSVRYRNHTDQPANSLSHTDISPMKSETIPADYSWTRPNRRHVCNGLYLPGIICEGVGEIAIAVDCSGSINARQLGLFEADVRSILTGQQPRFVHVLYFDIQVQNSETYHSGLPIKLTPVGGGGTDFRPCFRWLEERVIRQQMLVFLTDLYGAFPSDVPPYPVLWASTDKRALPFGQAIPMEAA